VYRVCAGHTASFSKEFQLNSSNYCLALPHGRLLMPFCGIAVLVQLAGCQPDVDPTPGVDEVALALVADGFTAPVGMAFPPDGSGRIFVVEQTGQIYIIAATGTRLAAPFLDIADRMVAVGIDFGGGFVFDERGLLGLAFHPQYAANGRFYVFYSAPKDPDDPDTFNCESHISEFRVSPDDPNRADPDSERLLLEINKPQFNHNGGQLAFGPDGYLYIGVGDGGGANDAGNANDNVGHNPFVGNGQDLSTLLGKVLRIDVDGGDPYGIPADNPFVEGFAALPEIWVYGLRNPWRFAFDGMGRMFLTDVGQNLYEEVNLITAGGGNYGWRVREGLHCFDKDNAMTPPADCPDVATNGDALIDPILEYPHSAAARPFGISVTGGFVYEGDAIPALRGDYVFGDWSSSFAAPDGSLFAATQEDDGTWTMRELSIAGAATSRLARFITSFGRDPDGELYLVTTLNSGPIGSTGAVHRIVAAP